MTLTKIAKLAGVSVATVSKALANSKEISRETSEKILQIARETGYLSQRQKRRKETQKVDAPRIALLCPEIVSPSYAYQATIFRKDISRMGGEVHIYICSFEAEQIRSMILRIAEEGSADGILVQMSLIDGLEEPIGIPVVFTGKGNSSRFDSVYCSLTGFQKALEHLKSLGHTDIGFVGEPLTQSKEDTFRNLMRQEALPLQEDFIYLIDKRCEEIGWQAAQQIAGQKKRPTALICAYDEVAIGLMRGLQEHGIRIPEDISLIGMNDIPMCSYTEPPLSTIREHTEERYNLAAQLLWRKIQDPSYTIVQNIQVESELVLRASTAPPQKI